MKTGRRALSENDYRRLARWRYALRRFLRRAEVADRKAGISPAQYQLLVTVRGFPDGPPTVADLAEWLQVEHQSAVGLIDRCERTALVRRETDRKDRRRVFVLLTPLGRRVLKALAAQHLKELESLRKAFPLRLTMRNTNSGNTDSGKETDHA